MENWTKEQQGKWLIGLVKRCVCDCRIKRHLKDDAVSIGLIAGWKEVEKCNNLERMPLKRHIYSRVRRAIVRFATGEEEGREQTTDMANWEDNCEQARTTEDKTMAEKAVDYLQNKSHLTSHEKRLITLVRDGKSYAEIGEIYGMSKGAIYARIQHAIEKMRGVITKSVPKSDSPVSG